MARPLEAGVVTGPGLRGNVSMERMGMRHRDRVQVALDHRPPDRCPMQISFTPEFARRLQADLHTQGRGVHNPHGGGNTYELERAIGEDMLLTSVGWVNSYYRPGYESCESYVDEWGVTWKTMEYTTRFGSGRYTEPVGHPLMEDEAVGGYVAPDPTRPSLYEDATRVLHEYGEEYWIVGVVVTTVFECAWALRGYERLLMDFLVNPDLAGRVLDFPFRYHEEAARRLVEMGVDMIWLGDDVGGQSSMLLSPAMWRRFLKPRLAAIIDTIRAVNPGIKVAYHSDGWIEPIIADLIEIGVDVLNPLQPTAMDLDRLGRQYGERLCFWGSIDIQHTLPYGSPSEVADEVRERMKTLGGFGGLILGPTHNVQLDTPMDNFWAMVQAINATTHASLGAGAGDPAPSEGRTRSAR
jgi:uroporphyrinogen decarboxylase